jgi:hypothetical protein
MRCAILIAVGTAALMGRMALAQEGDDPIAQLRACSTLEPANRLECLDRLSRTVTTATPPVPKENAWIVSQTRSPVDYSPIATAALPSREVAGRGTMQFAIRCRDGRTELAVTGSAVANRSEDYAISYRINGGQPVQIAAGAPAFGPGVAFRVDPVALIQSLPGDGDFALHLSPRVGPALDASFSLSGLEAVRAKISSSCKWPHAIARPND